MTLHHECEEYILVTCMLILLHQVLSTILTGKESELSTHLKEHTVTRKPDRIKLITRASFIKHYFGISLAFQCQILL